MTVDLRVYPDSAATLGGFAKGDCEAMTTDNSGLFAERLKLEKPGDAIILPEIISKEPLGTGHAGGRYALGQCGEMVLSR